MNLLKAHSIPDIMLSVWESIMYIKKKMSFSFTEAVFM